MNPISQPSFIPKNPTTQPNKRVRRKSASMTLATFLTLLLFIIAIVATGSLFFYQMYLKSSIADKREALAQAEKSFNPELIQELKRLDVRLQAARTLLNQHVAFTQFFKLLGENTLSNVQFENFKSSADPGGTFSITADGRAQSFNTIALQSEQLKNVTFLNNPTFSNLNLDERGNVEFSLKAGITSSAVRYNQGIDVHQDGVLENGGEGSINPSPEAEATTTATSTVDEIPQEQRPGS